MEHHFQAVVSEWKKSNLEWALMGMGKGIRRERHYRPLRQLKLALLMRQEETYVWACQQWAAVEGALTCVSQRGTGERDGIRVIWVFLAVHCLERGSGGAKWPAFNLKVLTGQGLH